MRIAMFYHSLISDWNHGNAHFLRGMTAELQARGHRVDVYEPQDGWSFRMLRQTQGRDYQPEFKSVYPELSSTPYAPDAVDFDRLLDGVDLAIVHEWNEPKIVNRIAAHRRRRGGYRLLFHDTHHRSVSVPEQIRRFDLEAFDGVLAFGEVIRQIYLKNRWASNIWTWHEAADVRVFKPIATEKDLDLIWVGNWGDEERSQELEEFLIGPVRDLGITAQVYGVRYPQHALQALRSAGIDYKGWAPNFYVPQLFARARVTVHIPRRYYTTHLPGIPTIRPFEAMACGIPLICSPWQDCENLFRRDSDYLAARDGGHMKQLIRRVLDDTDLAHSLSLNGRNTILKRHTCGHRADELMEIISPAPGLRGLPLLHEREKT